MKKTTITIDEIKDYLSKHTELELEKELNDFNNEIERLLKLIGRAFQKHKMLAAAANIAFFGATTTYLNGKIEHMMTCSYGTKTGMQEEFLRYIKKEEA